MTFKMKKMEFDEAMTKSVMKLLYDKIEKATAKELLEALNFLDKLEKKRNDQ